MKKLLTKSIVVLLVSTAFVACQKETEPITQSNETATTFTPGPGLMEFTQRGPNGSVVIYSNWIPKIESDWSGIGTHEIKTNIDAPSLSDAIKNSGVVLMYYEYEGNIWPLPHTWFDDTYSETVHFSFVKQKITITLRFFGNVIQGIVPLKFRYVLIPGTQSGGRIAAPIDYNDYNAVCEYYGIAK